MWKTRKHFAAAILGSLLGFSGAGGGCDMADLNSLNSLMSTLDSFDTGYDYYDSSYNVWGPSSQGYDILDRKSG